MIVRAATESDLPVILEITNEAIANGTAIWRLALVTLETRREWMRERENHGFPVFVVEDEDGTVRGFGSYGPFRTGEGYSLTVEHSVYVHPSAQGKGLGAMMLGALVEHATAAGIHVMVGGIDAGNAASIKLHRKAGFEEVGCLRQVGRKFDRWLDLLFMQKVLER